MAGEVVRLLVPEPGRGGVFVDGTLGGGGHARALLEAAGPGARLLGVDRDPDALTAGAAALGEFGEAVRVAKGRLGRLSEVALREGFTQVDGVVVDLGVSSHQLDDGGRGFSFSTDAALDMRMDRTSGESASALLERVSVEALASMLRDFGDVPRARRVAAAILRAGAPATTRDLAARVERAVGRGRRHHPATLVFQALRIAVNEELSDLDAFLGALPAPLAPGGRVAVIAYHSLEDRRVKRAFRAAADCCTCPRGLAVCGCGRTPTLDLVTRKALQASEAEIAENPRARSARLRVASRPGELAA